MMSFGRTIAKQLSQLRQGVERIESGDYRAMIAADSRDELGELIHAFNQMADVLRQREQGLRQQHQVLAALNQRYEAVLNASNDGIAMLDCEGRFALVNRRFGELLGSRPDTLLHHPAEEASPVLWERLARLSSRLAALLPGDLGDSREVAEEIIALDDADRNFLQLYTAPVQGEDGRETIGRIVALRDVTRERELDKMKTDFISVVSHELRTPLTSIKGYTDLLLSGAAGEVTEIQTEFLGIIQSSTTRLSNLINDILDISRIESGTIDIKHEPVDYRKIVSDTLRLMKAAADEKHISMDAALPETLPPVRGDADKVMQVLGQSGQQRRQVYPARRLDQSRPGSDGRGQRDHLHRRQRHRHRAGRPEEAVPEVFSRRQHQHAGGRRDGPGASHCQNHY